MAEKDLQDDEKEATTSGEEALTPPVDNNAEWDELLKDEEESSLVVEDAVPKEEEVAAAETAEEKPPVEEPKTEEAKAAQPPATPKPDAVPSEPAVKPAEPAAPKGETEEELAAKRKKWREDSEAQLATVLSGQLSPEDVEALRLEPEKVLPRLLARASMDVYDAVVGSMQMQMPQAMAHFEQQRQQAQQAETVFYQQWPQLNKPEHKEIVSMTVQMYRQLNPQASFEQTVKEAGAMAMVALRLPLETTPPAPAAEAPPAKPAFRPASPGGGAPATKPVTGKSDNPFTQLAEEMINED